MPVLLIATRAQLSRRVFYFHAWTKTEEKAFIWAVLTALEGWHVQDCALQSHEACFLLEGFRDEFPELMDVDVLMEIMREFSWREPLNRLREVCQVVTAA